MSETQLAPNIYTIENNLWKKQLVSVGGEDAIVGCQRLVGGTQSWKLEYKDGYATFQGMPPYLAEGKYIALDSTASCRFALCVASNTKSESN
ncbi:hypothetical protein AZE42_07340 [Rhizopogon vesiculosus]|uniref:Uncharacterized protein n=1 Tax=Rhizopogon vesiculosus TaxID=180088 RepID=A0A1J8PV19_9AGAM|nr:hypothetical protein AZE42_07340 [Rhizopogon vesiculosus]